MKLTDFVTMRQYSTENLDAWLKRFQGASLAVDDCGGKAVSLPDIAGYSDDDTKKEEFMAMLFFLHSDRFRFGDKIRKFQEDMEEGNDNYPQTV